ncbi:MAG: DinB family protein [Thaumarchaeota archaeon]|nr:DinB family protein [Nitrososphaerota archaeon]
MEIRYLYDYSRAVRRRFANKFSELPWEDVSKNREASFYSMKNVLLHAIDNEDWIVNYAILGRTKDYSKRKSDEYTSMQMILDHLAEVEKKTIAYFSSATETEFKRHVDFELSSGKKFDLTVEECLIQSFTEQLYHLGEVICLLWEDDIEPPPMQWFYNRPNITV